MVESRFWPVTGPWDSEGVVDADSGLGGRLETRGVPLGGTGKAPILVVFLSVFPGLGRPVGGATDVVLSVGMLGVV